MVLDSVASVSAEGPLNAEGAPVQIAEYSDTIIGGWKRVVADGVPGMWRNWLKLVAQPAKFHMPLLREYLPQFNRRSPTASTSCHGLLVVCTSMSEKERRETCEAARALVHAEQQPGGGYNLLASNCELVAFMLNTTTRRYVSPQVPHNLWILFRLALQLVGLLCLYTLSAAPADYHKSHFAATSTYHIFATIPVSLQVRTRQRGPPVPSRALPPQSLTLPYPPFSPLRRVVLRSRGRSLSPHHRPLLVPPISMARRTPPERRPTARIRDLPLHPSQVQANLVRICANLSRRMHDP